MGDLLLSLLAALLAAALLIVCLMLSARRGGVGHNPVVPGAVVMRDGRLEVASEDAQEATDADR